jgi:hypothetical protein
MHSKKRLTICAALAAFLWTACQKNATVAGNDPDPSPVLQPDDLPPTDNSVPTVNILWDDASARKISHDVYFADYGRIHRAADGNLIIAYGCGPDANRTRTNIVIRRSTDNGSTWSAPQIVMNGIGQNNYSGFANPEILVMQNGWLMLAFEGKGKPDDNDHNNMQLLISKDNGLTWGDSKIVAKGRGWEPGMIQLPDGEIEMFWSSEAKWWPSNDVQQEILLSRSKDNGTTWSVPVTVAYANGMRDGMPTPVILKDNKGMLFTIESIRDNKSPYVIWSSMAARWNYQTLGSAANGRRWLATAENIFGAAPHIIQLPTGETLISFQADDGRGVSDFHKQTMLVYRANSLAKNAVRISDPWLNLPTNEGSYYSMLFLKDAQHVVLVTTRSMADGHSEVWWKEGRLVHNLSKTGWSIKEFSSEETNNNRLADKIIDNDVTSVWITRYSSNPTDYPQHFITVDMGAKKEVDGFSIAQKNTDRKIKNLQILVSDDNSTWKSVGEFTLRNKDREEQLLSLATRVACRYFKIVPKSGYDSQKQPGLAEVGAYTLD